jgi:hypothetical protein
MTGLISNIPMPTIAEEKAWLSSIVGAILNAKEANLPKHIIFMILGRKNKTDIPFAAIKLNSSELTMQIRNQFAAKRHGRILEFLH